MSIIYEERLSDSPYIATVTHGRTASDGVAIRPAESHWHMVVARQHGHVRLVLVGPWTMAGVVSYTEGAELLWIKLSLGAWLPHLPTKSFLDSETILPEMGRNAFRLRHSAWEFPDYDNVEGFINRLARAGVLVCDPVVNAVVHDQTKAIPARTVRHHFLRATGLTRSHIRQVERAKRAAALLQQGVPILDVVYQVGYFDQPHLTRSLKRFIGKTPAQRTGSMCTPV